MGVMFSRICEGLADADTAYERAHALAVKVVSLEKVEAGYTGEAIRRLSEAGQFGSWLKKLFHREKVTVHLHYYERLIRILEQKTAAARANADHVDMLIALAKGKRDAIDQGSLGMSSSAVRLEA